MNDEVMPYRKKAKKKTPKKFKHKHTYAECVVEYPSSELTSERGFVPVKRARVMEYCTVCGKIRWPENSEKWWERSLLGHYISTDYTDEYKRQINRDDRTLPTFKVDDEILFVKAVNLDAEIVDFEFEYELTYPDCPAGCALLSHEDGCPCRNYCVTRTDGETGQRNGLPSKYKKG